jgi:hypothetical protein
MPHHGDSPRPRIRGVPLIPELYSAARMFSDQNAARGQEDAEVREALSHCPQCGSDHFTEIRERR